MHSIQRSVLVPYRCEQMFDLVADVARYPEFMPWCGGTDVQWQNEHGMQATVQIRFAGIRQSFTTRNDHSYPHRIVFHLVDGPFSSLTGDWDFQALGEDGAGEEDGEDGGATATGATPFASGVTARAAVLPPGIRA